ncbi:MAG TPA: NAD-dependent epimerase/dehydratase family protein [Pedobacter sp.]|uniref:NAD-dependent epimerase/dehydratase family protein n=1 Tax=Pedobacter sp. TaxID=1411316 RepID=UPI002C430094|nr:NAD-dependent epimerase/dehydratase family protein [Pedobacter sp.]HMI01322.1 NAD-dependent epimerase/dehydratase family protein [Pedobacter sp.]
MMHDVILIIGANGQIGNALVPYLQQNYGYERVILSDITPLNPSIGIVEAFDATDATALVQVIKKYKVTQIYHLAAILSAKGELDPLWAWDLNMQSMLNVFEAARHNGVQKVFMPSSIAVFGSSAAKINTPQMAYLDPSTVYGVSKAAAENWNNYYFIKYKLDIRSIRYPGVISYQSMPGGGTTDYAVEMYHRAVLKESYTCFLKPETKLPMIYIDDVIRATLELMEAEGDSIKTRTSYNLSGMSFNPSELEFAIKKHCPDFKLGYLPDFRQVIADSWPKSIDDSEAQHQWGWKPSFDLTKMTEAMLSQLTRKYNLVGLNQDKV